MKNIFHTILTAVMMTGVTMAQTLDRSKRPEPAPAREIQLGDYKTFTLKNGLKVIVVENKKLPRLSLNLVFTYDPVLEGERAGLGNITGELIKNGSTSLPKEKFNEEVDFIGASLSTYSTGANISGLSRTAEKLFQLLSEVVINPAMAAEDFERIKLNAISGIQAAKDNPSAIRTNVTNVAFFGKNHPYGEVETEQSVDKITLDDCIRFHQTYFRPNTAILAVVGDISQKDARKLAQKYFGRWKKGQVPTAKYHFPASPQSPVVHFSNRNASVQSAIHVGNVIDLPPGHPDAIAMRIANQILGGPEGRLFLNLRETKGYTYGAYSRYNTDRIAGSFYASAEVRNEVTDSAISEIIKEIKRMRDELVTEAELNLAKKYISGTFGLSLENPQTIARFAIDIERYNLPKDFYKNYLKALNAVTAEDVRTVSRKYFNVDRAHIVVVGKASDVVEKLRTFGSIQFYDAFGNEISASGPAVADMNISPEQIIRNYIAAIGSEQVINSIKDITTEYSAEITGMPFKGKFITKRLLTNPPMMSNELLVDGMGSLQRTVYNGKKARTTSMMGDSDIPDEQLDDLRQQAMLVGESLYLNPEYSLKLTGVENIDGRPAYALEVKDKRGKITMEYFDTETFYKVRQEFHMETPQGKLSIYVEMGDYRDVQGLKIPGKIRQGQGNQSIQLTFSSAQINSGLKPEDFKL
jgi:zinc protease